MPVSLSSLLAACITFNPAPVTDNEKKPDGMVWIDGGTFVMGADRTGDPHARIDEGPAHTMTVDGFWIDVCEVTNARFAAFVEATGYVTTAERAPDWDALKEQLPPGTPKPPDELLAAGSLVFVPPTDDGVRGSWRWTPGASWQHPEGPESTIEARAHHPVIHVSHDDAVAFCVWAGRSLPTETEWEYAARNAGKEVRYPWGETPPTTTDANLWQGVFPRRNDAADGFAGTAPVGSFAASPIGLHDMAGNVWEWCHDWYAHDAYTPPHKPSGPEHADDPAEPTVPKRVMRGGSYLCHATSCRGYRVTARMKSSPDTGLSHTGFRTVLRSAERSAEKAP